MKVYVDELYSSCSSCPFFSDELLNCFASDDKELDFRFSKDFNRVVQRHPKCPLKSLADYTKQVRKEVCEKLKTILNESCYMSRHNSIDKETLFKVLDQIQGETNET